jgi:hypothetical protein
MNDTFLYKVKKHNTRLFIVMLLFTLGTLLCNLTGDEVTPFFVWGMYSAKEQPVEQYELLQTTINDSALLNEYDVYTGDTRFYLSSPLVYYKKITDNKGIDPTMSFIKEKLSVSDHTLAPLEKRLFNTDEHQQAFMNWYRRYIGQATGIVVRSLRVDVVKVHFNGASLVKDSVYLFETWSTP